MKTEIMGRMIEIFTAIYGKKHTSKNPLGFLLFIKVVFVLAIVVIMYILHTLQ